MASKVLAELRKSIQPRQKEFAKLYVGFFQMLSMDELSKIAAELGVEEAEAEGKLYEALKLFAVANTVMEEKALFIKKNDEEINAEKTETTIPYSTPPSVKMGENFIWLHKQEDLQTIQWS